MKKLLAFICLTIALSVSTAEAQSTILYPFGAAQGYTIANTGTTTVNVVNSMAYPSAIQTVTANTTVSVTVGSVVKPGAKILFAVTTATTSVITFTGSIISPTITGVTGKTFSQEFWYDGTYYRPSGASVQDN